MFNGQVNTCGFGKPRRPRAVLSKLSFMSYYRLTIESNKSYYYLTKIGNGHPFNRIKTYTIRIAKRCEKDIEKVRVAIGVFRIPKRGPQSKGGENNHNYIKLTLSNNLIFESSFYCPD